LRGRLKLMIWLVWVGIKKGRNHPAQKKFYSLRFIGVGMKRGPPECYRKPETALVPTEEDNLIPQNVQVHNGDAT